jgi:hypothetical protein
MDKQKNGKRADEIISVNKQKEKWMSHNSMSALHPDRDDEQL